MINSFIFTGLICAIAQIIKDNTKLTSGHITSLFVVVGAILSFLGLYGNIIDIVGGGAYVVIISFGNTLYQAALNYGILNMLSSVSVGVVTTILVAFIVTFIFKVKS